MLAAALLAAVSSPAWAAISAIGDVNPSPPRDGDSVFVGEQSPGFLRVDGGSSLLLSDLDVGGASLGDVIVEGQGSVLSTNFTLALGSDRVFNPGAGVARLTIRDGAFVQTNRLALARGSQPIQVTVDGSVLDVRNDIEDFLGGGRGGTIEVVGGGALSTQSSLETGFDISVRGAGSILTTSFQFRLLRGDLVVDQGASVFAGDRLEISPSANARLQGGDVIINRLENSGTFGGSGRVRVGFDQSTNSGRIEVLGNEELRFQGNDPFRAVALENFGEIRVDGGKLELPGTILNSNQFFPTQGSITLIDAELRLRTVNGSSGSPNLANESLLATTGGESNLFGSVENRFSGRIALTNDSTLIFHDEVINDGGEISVSAGSRAVFLQGLDMLGGTLLANLAGTNENPSFGTIEVVGGVSLSGQLNVALSGSLEPTVGDRFSLLTASGGVAGDLSLGETPALTEGLVWEIAADANSVALVAVPELDGDFNLDGIVNTADYAAWRDGLGTQFTAADYDRWIGNLGATAPGGLQAIPEPTGLALLALAGAAGATRRRTLNG